MSLWKIVTVSVIFTKFVGMLFVLNRWYVLKYYENKNKGAPA